MLPERIPSILFIGTFAEVQFTRPAFEAADVDGSLMQQHYYSVLYSVIMESARDDPHLRRTIYELARSTLQRRLDWEANELGDVDRAQKLRALESAIEQIEADLARNNLRPPFSETNILAPVTVSTIEIIPPARHASPLLELGYESTPERARLTFSTILSVLPLIAAAILGVAAYIAIERGVYEGPQPPAQADQNTARDITSSHPPTIPKPSAFGVYALTDGKLAELEPLPIKILDRGVAISGTLSTASKTNLPNGRAQFIAFRRDLVNNAPEKVIVRIIARVMSASAFSRNEEATIGNVRAWAIRSVSYELRVAPVDGNPAMIVIRPADTDFSFPAGRYALILKGVAYDFSVDGPITDLAQCVKRSEELNAAVYTQCRNP